MVERVDDNENVLDQSKGSVEASADPDTDIMIRRSVRRRSTKRKVVSLPTMSAKLNHSSSVPARLTGPPQSPTYKVTSSPASEHNRPSRTSRNMQHEVVAETKSENGGGGGILQHTNSERSFRLPVPTTTTSAKRLDEGVSDVQEEKRSWFEVMYPSYKSRNKEYKDLFNEDQFKFVVDFSCAHSKDILRQGRMYISTGYVCFYSKIFGYEHVLKIPFQDITVISKEKTAFLIPNAIQLVTSSKKTYFFATFHNRDSTFDILNKLWSTVKSGEEISEDEICQIIMVQYPEEEVTESTPSRPQSVSFSLGPAATSMDLGTDLNQNRKRDPGGQMSAKLKEVVTDWLETVPGDLVINSVIHKSVTEVQTLLFTNSNFYFTFQKNRGTTELDVGDWETGEGEMGRTREVSYNMKINNPVGPKTSQVKEIQIERTCSTPGQIYCIDLEAFNSGVPYADAFTVRTHICLHRESDVSSRIIVKAEIVFEKELWSYIKGKIESNAWNGLKSFYNDLRAALAQHREDVQEVADHYGDRSKPKTHATPKSVIQSVHNKVVDAQDSWSGLLFVLVIVMLCVTCVVNGIVLTNMYLLQPSLDTTWDNMHFQEDDPFADVDGDLLDLLPQTDKEWFQIFRAQVAQHHQIRQEISDSLKKITLSLSEAEKVLEHASDVLKRSSADNLGSLESLLSKLVNSKQP